MVPLGNVRHIVLLFRWVEFFDCEVPIRARFRRGVDLTILQLDGHFRELRDILILRAVPVFAAGILSLDVAIPSP